MYGDVVVTGSRTLRVLCVQVRGIVSIYTVSRLERALRVIDHKGSEACEISLTAMGSEVLLQKSRG
jgi:acetolactate synthase regulatory subunit